MSDKFVEKLIIRPMPKGIFHKEVDESKAIFALRVAIAAAAVFVLGYILLTKEESTQDSLDSPHIHHPTNSTEENSPSNNQGIVIPENAEIS